MRLIRKCDSRAKNYRHFAYKKWAPPLQESLLESTDDERMELASPNMGEYMKSIANLN